MQIMKVVIREPPPPQDQTFVALFFLSVTGRVNALPVNAANELTLPIPCLDLSQTHTDDKGSKLKLVAQSPKMSESSVAVVVLGNELKGRYSYAPRPNTFNMFTLKIKKKKGGSDFYTNMESSISLNLQVINMYLRLFENRSEEDTSLLAVKGSCETHL